MILTATDIYDLYRPSYCELRVFQKHAGAEVAEPGPFELLLRDLGERHERRHLGTLGPYEDVREGDLGERNARTNGLVQAGAAVIYQPVLMAPTPGHFGDHFVIGIPDLLLRQGDGYAIRDCKLARHADEGRHPEILRQLELYGWLFHQTFGKPPNSLEVLLGDGTLSELQFATGEKVLQVLTEIRDLASLGSEPYSPVGWTKCQGCGFSLTCWSRATATQDVAMVYGVDQALACLHERAQPGMEEYKALQRVARDTIDAQRWVLLRELAAANAPLTTKELAERAKMPINTAREQLENGMLLRIVDRSMKGDEYSWQLTEDMAQLFTITGIVGAS